MSTHLARGTWAVLATPFDADGALDTVSLAREIHAFSVPGVVGLVALGVFGEAARLTAEERATVVRLVLGETDLPVVIGLPGLTADRVLSDTEMVMAAAPRAPQALMVQVHVDEVDAAGEQLQEVHRAGGLPLVVQDYPVASGVTLSSGTLLAIVRELGDAVAGVKAESPPTSAAVAALASQIDAPVFGGLGGVGLLDELAAGSAGAMTGFSHPEAIAATVTAHERFGIDAAQDQWAPWLPLANFEGQARIGLAIRKEILRRRGILAHATVRPPAAPLPTALVPLLERHLSVPHVRSTPSWTFA
ncbi:dihydrodipicolinate synthase family protein [uncultured Aeromicrobium sp.]|uniref:dihydrodipicolinate synthase family protein n=1 Tax=uncultured Aeromicrobium sp. TaxID=337820 RepID=UPI0025F5A440|nr:dihydrodipicolinate synthase family protein [uncultured Aeromicrobium sp.]